ncbi:plasma kallikrein-like [Phlebotomus papatasi]|uniref:plasma kallikrein-like n=1 Tax=Phlebotomus papatasi TaxID=29031 RepID=UPI002483F1B7|nr:plasma kallikrein-like [Phlebotomus papatasi]
MIILLFVNLFIDSLADNTFLRLFGGTNATQGEFPHMISIQDFFKRWPERIEPHLCGGSILNTQWGLTAGHCIDNSRINTGQIRVVAGTFNLTYVSKDTQVTFLDFGIQHPKYKTYRQDYDVGVIHFKKPLFYNEYVQPVILPELEDPILSSEAVLSGWGIADVPMGFPRILQRADMRIIPIAECFNALKNDTSLQAGIEIHFNICTKPLTPGPTICSRDSGSPLGRWEGSKFLQIGIATWTPYKDMCIQKDTPVMYARVAAYTDWIRENSVCTC